jgi:hypothetical protein
VHFGKAQSEDDDGQWSLRFRQPLVGLGPFQRHGAYLPNLLRTMMGQVIAIEDAHGYGLDLALILGRVKEEENRDPSGGDLAEGWHRMSCISYASLHLMISVQNWPIISPRWLCEDVVLYR